MTRRTRLLLLLTALLMIAAVILLRPQFAPSPQEQAAADASALADRPMISPAAATASASAAAAGPDEKHGPTKREGVDAANLYADAFALFDQLTDEEKEMLRRPREEVDAEEAAQLFEKIQAIMALLRVAAKADHCDWGIDEINSEARVAILGKAQFLARLTRWAAGYRFSTEPSGAIDDLSALARLGHHLTDTVIGGLVAASIEASATSLVRDCMATLDAATMGKAVAFIEASSLDADLTHVMQGEISFVESSLKKLTDMTLEERIRMMLGGGGGSDPTPEDRTFAERMSTALSDPKEIEGATATIRGFHEQAAAAMRLPEAQFQAWLKTVESASAGGHPLVHGLAASYSGLQRTMQHLRVQRAMLSAAADILQNGPAQIGRYRDPATGGALLYVPSPTGFELRSPYQVRGKPVTMSFPGPTVP